MTFVDLGGEIGGGDMRGRRFRSWGAEMRLLDALEIAGRAPYGPHKRLEGHKHSWTDNHRGEYEQFKYIERTNTEVNATIKAQSKVLSDARHKVS
jgi:hypothetical protein